MRDIMWPNNFLIDNLVGMLALGNKVIDNVDPTL